MIGRMLSRLFLIALAGCGRIGFGATEPPPTDGVAQQDGPPADAEPQPLQNGCATTHPGVLLCEGFEAPDVEWDYEVLEGEGASAARTTERGAQGSASLKINIGGDNEFKAARWGLNVVLPSLAGGELHVREYVWMTGTTTISDQLSIMVTGNMNDPFPSANVLLTPGEIHAVVEGQDVAADFEFPRDRWVCVEIHIAIASTNGSFLIDVDGVPVAGASGLDTAVQGGYTNLDVGVHYATPAQSSAKLFIDEIVADTAAIGCN